MNLEKITKNIWRALNAYRAINDLPDSVVFLDSRGFVKRANQKAMECFGCSNSYIKIEDFIKEGLSVVKESVNNNSPVSATAIIPGREFYVEITARRTDDGFCIAIRDLAKLTSEIKKEEKVTKFNNEKNAMLIKVENDIKSPINSIIGFSQGLLTGLAGKLTEKQEKYIKIINTNSLDLNDYISRLMNFTYAESSLYEPDYRNFDVVEIVKNVIKKYSPIIEEKKLSFDFDYSKADKRIIYNDQKAFKNFFNDILEYSVLNTDSGYISIKIKEPDNNTAVRFGLDSADLIRGYMHISIKDTGVGIAEDEIKHACDPYSQLDKGKKNLLRAFSLGTASILVKRMCGNIYIASESMRGTAFDVLIPVEKDIHE